MPDSTAKTTTGKTTKADKVAAISARMGGLAAAPEAETAERSQRSARAAAQSRRKAPPTTARTVRSAPMPAEQPRPPKLFSARISHTTTPDQLEALEEVSRQAKRQGAGAVPLTSLLRAAAQICLDDTRLRERMVKHARTEWR